MSVLSEIFCFKVGMLMRMGDVLNRHILDLVYCRVYIGQSRSRIFFVNPAFSHQKFDITETSPYKSDPRFPPYIIVKIGEIWGWNQNDKNG